VKRTRILFGALSDPGEANLLLEWCDSVGIQSKPKQG
jgi:hypothetical protein